MTKKIKKDTFEKADKGKIRLDLVPPSSIEALGEVFTYGSLKYEALNFLQCTDPSRFVGALLRHIEAYRNGEELDAESGLPHLAHAMTNISILIELDRQGVKHESYFNK